ncbi:sugar transporter-domain-containing protein [Xylaria arbuscula]|nr:sugar transporter-domain-containing protein [Xylaria arbuscula]
MSFNTLGSDGEDRDEKTIAYPFADCDVNDIHELANSFIAENKIPSGDEQHVHHGALLASDPKLYCSKPDLLCSCTDPRIQNKCQKVPYSETDIRELQLEARELDNKSPKNILTFVWKRRNVYRKRMYALLLCCGLGAAVQGWDETAVNGAQVFYSHAFQINTRPAIIGLVNAAPYFSSSIACLLTSQVNTLLGGRKPVIFTTCLISSAACFGQAFTTNWQTLLATRLILGVGIGLKSVTIPIYISECAPAQLRGAFVMVWQLWTALGILFGFAFGRAFLYVSNDCMDRIDTICARHSNNWRYMLGSPAILPLIPLFIILHIHESPRFIFKKALNAEPKSDERARLVDKAIKSLESFNKTRLQAYREAFFIYHSVDKQQSRHRTTGLKMLALWKHEPTRRALVASIIVMFFQQACGINILAYYSNIVLGGLDPTGVNEVVKSDAFDYSLGFGAINFLVAIPALLLIDTFGRRRLLLLTFCPMGIFQILTGIGIGKGTNTEKPQNTPLTVASIYIFCAIYSIGEGPVPFVYASESMPLYHRDLGMGVAASVNWLFNAILGLTWPLLVNKVGGLAAFSIYGAFCFLGFIVILL